MAKEFFNYDPLRGVTEYFDYDESGTAHITTVQDIQPYIDYATGVRNEGLSDRKYKKQKADWAHYAIIPPVVQLDLLNKGINISDPSCTKRLLEEINKNYPYLKLTDKTHASA